MKGEKRLLKRLKEIWYLKGGEKKVWVNGVLWDPRKAKDENGEAEILDDFEGLDSFQKDQAIADQQGLL